MNPRKQPGNSSHVVESSPGLHGWQAVEKTLNLGRVVPNPSGQLSVLQIKLVRRARKVHSLPCFPPGKEIETQAWQSMGTLLLAEGGPALLGASHD